MRLLLAKILIVCLLGAVSIGAYTKEAVPDGSLFGQLEAMERQHQSLSKKIKKMKSQQQELLKLLKKIEGQQNQTGKQLLSQQKQLLGRLRESYKLSNLSGWEYLLGAKDFGDFVLRRHYLKYLLQNDKLLLDKYQGLLKSIELKKLEIADKKNKLDQLVSKLKNQEKQLSEKLDLKRKFVAGIGEDKDLKKKAAKELKIAKKDLDKKVADLKKTGKTNKANKHKFSELKGQLKCPVKGRIEQKFGEVSTGESFSFHGGWDLRARAGYRVRVPAAGKVVFAGNFRGFGNLIVIDHGEKYHTLYAHLRELLLPKGETVKAGDIVGHVGDTGSLKGAYLYFELRHKGKATDPLLWVKCH